MIIFYVTKVKFGKDGKAKVSFEFTDSEWKRNSGFREFFCYSETRFIDHHLLSNIFYKFQEIWERDHPGLKCILMGDNCGSHVNVQTMLRMRLKGVQTKDQQKICINLAGAVIDAAKEEVDASKEKRKSRKLGFGKKKFLFDVQEHLHRDTEHEEERN